MERFNYVRVISSCFGETTGENGNIRGNPLFKNTSGDSSQWDFHLQNGSPCIDSGTLDGAPERDILGRLRPGNDGKICMGALESEDYYTSSIPQPPIRLYVNKTGSGLSGNSWDTAYPSITSAMDNATSDALYDIWVAEGVYQEGNTIYIPGRFDFSGGFLGTESSLEERSIFNHPTILEGDETNPCVRNFGYTEGFHVTKGNPGIVNYNFVKNCEIYDNHSSSYGGGIYNYCGMVSNCRVYNNTAIGDYTYGGGGIHNSLGIIKNCLVYGNSSEGIANGIDNSYGLVENCTVYGNTTDWGWMGSEGITSYMGSTLNCVIWGHEWDIRHFPDGYTAYSCYENSYIGYSNGNIPDPPCFVNTDGDMETWDFHLQDDSPCIDAGNPDEEYNDRCIPPGIEGLRNDMGAYGGPGNCDWEIEIVKDDLVDYLLGRRLITSRALAVADKNSDGIIDIADIVYLITFTPSLPGK
jgi:hypothetical protein